MNPATVSHCPEPSSSHPAIEFLMPSAQGTPAGCVAMCDDEASRLRNPGSSWSLSTTWLGAKLTTAPGASLDDV